MGNSGPWELVVSAPIMRERPVLGFFLSQKLQQADILRFIHEENMRRLFLGRAPSAKQRRYRKLLTVIWIA
jgi:hypothetical protein